MYAKLVIYGIAGLAVASIITLAYLHYKGLVDENATFRENNAVLRVAVDQQQAAVTAATEAVKAWKDSAARLEVVISEMTDAQRLAATQTRKLNDVFAKHDLEALTLRKPGLIQRRINSGSAANRRMLECITSGADHCSAGPSKAADARTP